MAIKSREKNNNQGKVAPSAAGIVKIAGIQMASGPNVSANLSEAERLIKIAADQGAKLIVLPEYFAIMGIKDTDKVKVGEAEGKGPIQQLLSSTAKKRDVWIVAGSVPLQSETKDKVYNACMVYNNQGKLVARYNKIHLFGLNLGNEKYHEESTIIPGNQVVTVESPFGKIGLSICYDLRFPELYRAMGEVDLILVPAAFTETTGKAHWETLVRARAIENQCYVLAPAQGGYHASGRETHGDSMIVDPWGVVLDRLPRGSGVDMASMNLDYQTSLRKSLPALKHKTVFK